MIANMFYASSEQRDIILRVLSSRGFIHMIETDDDLEYIRIIGYSKDIECLSDELLRIFLSMGYDILR